MANVMIENIKKTATSALVIALILSPSQFSYAQSNRMSLSDFLNQVKQGHQGFQASQKTIESSEQRAGESKLSTRPSLLGSAQYLNDKRETGSPLQGDTLILSKLLLSIKE